MKSEESEIIESENEIIKCESESIKEWKWNHKKWNHKKLNHKQSESEIIKSERDKTAALKFLLSEIAFPQNALWSLLHFAPAKWRFKSYLWKRPQLFVCCNNKINNRNKNNKKWE